VRRSLTAHRGKGWGGSGLVLGVVAALLVGCTTKQLRVENDSVITLFSNPLGRSSIGRDPRLRATFDSGWEALQARQLSTAQSEFERLLRATTLRDAELFPVRTARGIVRLAAGETDRAMADFEAALASVPGYPSAILGRAATLWVLGDDEGTLAALDPLFELDSEHRGAAELRMRATTRLTSRALDRSREAEARGDLAAALTAVEAAAERAPESAALQKRWGRLALASGRLDVAVQAYRAATSLDPQDTDSWIGLGEAHMRAGANADARAAFDTAIGLPGGRERALGHVRELRDAERTSLAGSPRLQRAIDAPVLDRAGMAALLVASLPPLKRVRPAGRPIIITDLSGSWARSEIQDIVALGVLDVYENNTFRPSAPVTRIMMAQVCAAVLALYRRAGWLAERPARTSQFVDLPPEHLAHDDVVGAVRYDVMRLDSNDAFRPFVQMGGREAMDVVARLARVAG